MLQSIQKANYGLCVFSLYLHFRQLPQLMAVPILCLFSINYVKYSFIILGVYKNIFTCFNVYKKLLKHLYFPSAWAFHFSACLFKTPFLKRPVSSDWSALTGLSRHHPLCFRISSACFVVFFTVSISLWMERSDTFIVFKLTSPAL